LRVVFLSDALEERNGAGTYYHDLIEHLRGHLERVEMFSPRGGSRTRYEYLSLPMPGDPTQQLRLPSPGRLSQAIQEIDPHVVAAATPGPYGFFACLLAKRSRLPLCAGHHTRFDRLGELYWQGKLGRLTGRTLAWIFGLLFRAASVVVATSPEMDEHARRVGAKRVVLVGTPISKRFLSDDPPPAPSRVQSVLYAGRLASEKNIEAVLDAAERLSDVRFVVAGDGPQRPLVQAKADELANLQYVGWVAREKVVALFDQCDMLVLPSHVESFGTVASEAMARRRLVVVSPHCGILDWKHLGRGVICMHSDETLADALRRVAGWDGSALRRKAEQGHRAVQTLNDRTVEHWLNLLAWLARSKRRGRRAREELYEPEAVASC
jgi:glycosyltransferase involved in cell wall biosynthesis